MPCEISLVLCDDVRPDADEVKALFMASKFGNTEDLESLLRKGINPNKMIDVDSITLPSPLAYASGEGHFECVRALLDARACIDDRNKNGETALRRACSSGHPEVVELLLRAGASQKADRYGRSPLFCCCQVGNLKLAKLLLDAAADANQVTKEGQSPLWIGCSTGRCTQIVKLLLEARADKNLPDQDGRSPLLVAASVGALGPVKLLVDAGALTNQSSKEGKSPLWTASAFRLALGGVAVKDWVSVSVGGAKGVAVAPLPERLAELQRRSSFLREMVVIKDQATGEDWCFLARNKLGPWPTGAIGCISFCGREVLGLVVLSCPSFNFAFAFWLGQFSIASVYELRRWFAAMGKDTNDKMPEVDPWGLVKFFPVLVIGVVLPRVVGGAIAVAILQKGSTELYNDNIKTLVKALQCEGSIQTGYATAGYGGHALGHVISLAADMTIQMLCASWCRHVQTMTSHDIALHCCA
eukprot:Skav236107  [mRNA]  locus=scaffold1166:365205:380963:+ [translate_table: standard]